MESNDSPEIPDRGETPDIPGLPSGDLRIGKGENWWELSGISRRFSAKILSSTTHTHHLVYHDKHQPQLIKDHQHLECPHEEEENVNAQQKSTNHVHPWDGNKNEQAKPAARLRCCMNNHTWDIHGNGLGIKLKYKK